MHYSMISPKCLYPFTFNIWKMGIITSFWNQNIFLLRIIFSFLHIALIFISIFYINYFSKLWINPYASCKMFRSLLFPLRCLIYFRIFLHFYIYMSKVKSISISLIFKLYFFNYVIKHNKHYGMLYNMK